MKFSNGVMTCSIEELKNHDVLYYAGKAVLADAEYDEIKSRVKKENPKS